MLMWYGLIHAVYTQYDERAVRIEFAGLSQIFVYVDVQKTKGKGRPFL